MLVRTSGSSSATKMCDELTRGPSHSLCVAGARTAKTVRLSTERPRSRNRRPAAVDARREIQGDERCIGVVLVLDEREHVDTASGECAHALFPRVAFLGTVAVAPKSYVGVLGRELFRAYELVVVVDAQRCSVFFEHPEGLVGEPRNVAELE